MKNAPPLQQTLFPDLLHYLAPALCAGCSEPIEPRTSLLCDGCRYSIEPAPYPEEMFNTIWGAQPSYTVGLSSVGSLFRFEHESAVQRVLHAIKYQGCRRLARDTGRELGETLSIFPEFRDFDVLVPIPLHRSRQRERGYNQATEIAFGVAHSLAISVETRVVTRVRHTRSQTTLGRAQRLSNVKNVFSIVSDQLRGAKVLLVDDVLTTGATLQAVAEGLLYSGVDVVSAMTLAFDDITLSQGATPTFEFAQP